MTTLNGAHLDGADATNACFIGADLKDATFEKAVLSGAVVCPADVSAEQRRWLNAGRPPLLNPSSGRSYRASEVKPPPARFDVELLEDAIRATAAEVHAPLPDELGGGTVHLGDELDIRQLDAHERRQLAGYLAKYATKSTEQAGGVPHRVTEHQLDMLPVREHVRAYMRTAFTLAGDPALAERRFAPCAHALGYRGHCLTKSRRYSTTFKALREARERHVHKQILARSRDAAQRALAEAGERDASFRYVGQGHLTAADALLAASAAAGAREQRRIAREERLISGRMVLTSGREVDDEPHWGNTCGG